MPNAIPRCFILLTQKLRLAVDAIEEAALQLVARRAQTFDECAEARVIGMRVSSVSG
jgi:hypothetical protein